jgi:WD40 repeat protein
MAHIGFCWWLTRNRYALMALLMTAISTTATSPIAAADPVAKPKVSELVQRDLATWRELWQARKFAELDAIADDLRTQRTKFPNGRGKLWRFAWTPLSEQPSSISDEQYAQIFATLDAWIAERPDSVNPLLLKAHAWQKYAFQGRGRKTLDVTTNKQLDVFEVRCREATKILDELETRKFPLDSVYHRLRIELAKGLGKKPDVEWVYEGLQADPRDMELVHGMAICLLPRWFGDPGELEQFAEEVARRTADDCGDMQYAITAIGAMDLTKSFVLIMHAFEWPRIQNGLHDLQRLYPESDESLNYEALFAFMAEDLEALFAVQAKLGPAIDEQIWRDVEIPVWKFRERMTPEMLSGDHKKLFLGHPQTVMSVEALGKSDVILSTDWYGGVQFRDLSTGEHKNWAYIDDVSNDSISIHAPTATIATGIEGGLGVLVHSFGRGPSGHLQPSDRKFIETAFSPAGDLLAIADDAGVVSLINLKEGTTEQTWNQTESIQVYGMAFLPDSSHLAIGCQNGRLLLVNYESGELITERMISTEGVHSVAANREYIAVGTGQGTLLLLNRQTLAEVKSTKTLPFGADCIVFSPKGDQLACGLRHGHWETPMTDTLYVWNFQTETEPRSLRGHKFGVNRVAYTHNGKQLLSVSHDWSTRLWDLPAVKK